MQFTVWHKSDIEYIQKQVSPACFARIKFMENVNEKSKKGVNSRESTGLEHPALYSSVHSTHLDSKKRVVLFYIIISYIFFVAFLVLRKVMVWALDWQHKFGQGKWKSSTFAPQSLLRLRCPWARPLTPTALVELLSGKQVRLGLYWAATRCGCVKEFLKNRALFPVKSILDIKVELTYCSHCLVFWRLTN